MNPTTSFPWESLWTDLEQVLARGDDERAEVLLQQLLLRAPAEALLPRLEAWAHDRDPERRWWALRGLAQLPHPRSRALLREALQDPDPAIAMVAALGLRHQPDEQALPQLVNLLSHPDRLLAHLASDALAALGPKATPALLHVIEQGPQEARALAVRALARVRDRRAIPLLFRLLDDPSPLITQWAEEGLEALGVGMVFFQP